MINLNKTKRFYVYSYIDPRNNQVFYIGKGTGRRYKQHLTDKQHYSHNKRMNGRIRHIKEAGLLPIIELVQKGLTEQEALQLEEKLVIEYGRIGFDKDGILLNITPGGIPGPIMVGENNPFYGKTHSTETKEKLSKSRKGLKLSEETRQKISDSHVGKSKSQEHKKKISESHIGITHSTETKEKLSKYFSKTWKLTSPRGEIIIVTNLNKWAKENGFHQGSLANVAIGRVKQHKGWKCEKLQED